MTTQRPLPAIVRLEKAATRHAVPADGTSVVWRRFGKGPPLVLLHGGHGSWLHWARNIDALSGEFELWLPDLPGYGDSAQPMEPTLDALVTATRISLDALIGAQTPMALAGFSFGGLVAAHLAAQRPGVTRMALLGPAGHGGPRRPRGDLRSWREAHARQDRAALPEVMRHNLLMHMLAGDDADALALEIHLRSCMETRFHSKTISRSGGLADCLRRFGGPLLLLWGEHDVTATPRELSSAFQRECVDARAEVIEGAGHWVQYQAAESINSLLLDWFRDRRARGAGPRA
jgi:pimeloyl-ACP methyl ester carboxylesterase